MGTFLHRARLLMPVLLGALVGVSAQTFAWLPNESQVSSERELIDYEFSQTRSMITWVDATGKLYIAAVNRETGLFEPTDGRGTVIDSDAESLADAGLTMNGPEWAHFSDSDLIVYTKFVSGKPHTKQTARLAEARQAPDGTWSYAFLSPRAPRLAVYASNKDGDLGPLMTYIDPRGNHYVRETGQINTEQLIADAPASKWVLRPVTGSREVLYCKPVNGIKQVHTYNFDSHLSEQLTFDEGDKSASWMWQAPEFNNEFVLSTVLDTKVRIYRKLPGSDGTMIWTAIRTIDPPPSYKIYSPEPFVYNGKSYVFLALGLLAYDFPSEIWIANIDATNPDMRRISADQPLRVRADPEVFITSLGPRIYFNRFTTTGGPDPKKCFSIDCSEGVWFADPNLFNGP